MGRSKHVWDRALLAEMARTLKVDEATIRRNVRHLMAALGPELLAAWNDERAGRCGAVARAACRGQPVEP